MSVEPFLTKDGLAVHTKGAALRIGVCERTIKSWRFVKPLPIPFTRAGRTGRCIRYLVADIDAYLAARRVTK